ncbi:MAG: hypothetical protein Q4B43_01790 [Bacteroidota bacterium]|nr:hypothetical protein [Bacteroidota bacterium]
MGFEYKIKTKLTTLQITEIVELIETNACFERKYQVNGNDFWDLKHTENQGDLPNVSLMLESDGIYICQWGTQDLWQHLDKLKNYFETENTAF